MTVHPVFDDFAAYSGEPEPDIFIDWLGARFPRRLLDPWPGFLYEAVKPDPGEEIFEWIDLLTAAVEATDQFTMVELGAGWGRWGLRGAMAARQRGIANIAVRLVEAEPQHAAWARECVALNGLSDTVKVIEGAISYAGAPVLFTIDYPGLDAATWYGQEVSNGSTIAAPTEEIYLGKQIQRTPDGRGFIEASAVTLEEVMADLHRIDVLDADLQGAEMTLVENAMEAMTAKVALAHIGTHGEAIEGFLRDRFRHFGWQCRWDFAGGGVRETPFGEITFQDGVQTWVNPELAHSAHREVAALSSTGAGDHEEAGVHFEQLVRELEEKLSTLQSSTTETTNRLETLEAQHDAMKGQLGVLTNGVRDWLLPTLAKHSAAITRRRRPLRMLRPFGKHLYSRVKFKP